MKSWLVIMALAAMFIGCIGGNGSGNNGFPEELDLRELEYQIHLAINEERVKVGVVPMGVDLDLQRIARKHSEDMLFNGFFSYTNQRGENPSQRAEKHGYSCHRDYGGYHTEGVAESISLVKHAKSIYEDGRVKEYNTQEELVQQVINSWIGSGQARNMLSVNYTRDGIGVAKEADSYDIYVTADFC